jgi:transposase
MALQLRALTDVEAARVRQLAQARSMPARTVQRAQIIWQASQGQRAPAIARAVGVSEKMVRCWLRRFNAHGLEGLADAPRSGRPPTYPPEQVGALIAAVLSKPADHDLPFANWTLDRLVAYLSEQRGLAMKRSRVDEILLAEGVRWRTQETWFGERVDPDFAEKRGRSCSSTRTHRHTA